MSFNLNNLSESERNFLQYKNEISRREIMKYLENGLSFSEAIITEGQESICSYYNWVKNNVKDEDKYKIDNWDNEYSTNYTGQDLNEYEKKIFDKLPNIGKWQVSNYSRMWRGLDEAEECIYEFIYHELNYLWIPISI